MSRSRRRAGFGPDLVSNAMVHADQQPQAARRSRITTRHLAKAVATSVGVGAAVGVVPAFGNTLSNYGYRIIHAYSSAHTAGGYIPFTHNGASAWAGHFDGTPAIYGGRPGIDTVNSVGSSWAATAPKGHNNIHQVLGAAHNKKGYCGVVSTSAFVSCVANS
jgi:hypothetical protein